MTGKLYLVPTPIGNLADTTHRALTVLSDVGTILSEDTRVTQKLLHHFEISAKLLPYHEHNEEAQLPKVLELLQEQDVALVSDAGSPGISDPGYRLVKVAIEHGITIVPLPGPTALIPALTASGLPTDKFIFLGFLPKKAGPKHKYLEQFANSPLTLVLYESPRRLVETLNIAHDTLGERQICIAREISKQYESFYRLSLSKAITDPQFSDMPGEIVVVIGGKPERDTVWSEPEVKLALSRELKAGVQLKMVAKAVALESGWSKSEVYKLGLELNQHEN